MIQNPVLGYEKYYKVHKFLFSVTRRKKKKKHFNIPKLV